MSAHLLVEALRFVVGAYLIALAVAAVLGAHRSLLAYPFQALYATVRIIVLTATLGRVRLVKSARGAQRKQARRLRGLRYSISELRESRQASRDDEERGRVRGEWASGAASDELEGPSAPFAPGPPVGAPDHSAPPQEVEAIEAPLLSVAGDDDDDAPPSLY
jgi:pimeloyl-ACP methyl ester carboxylesterase